ncbi:MAG: lipoyl(octanoyl) transferase LipB [Phycisphaerae bacterium]
MQLIDLDTLDYRAAWAEQEKHHARVLAGGEPCILLVEHPPTITFGRRAELSASHLVVPRDNLRKMGVDLVESDRGGDITYHGPGQLVAYPILKLADHKLSVGGYVRRLQECLITVLAKFHIAGELDPSAVGVWVRDEQQLAKVCAVGVRVRRGVTLHGLALNVEPDLRMFDLIVPCGLAGRPVTSLRRLLGHRAPSFHAVQSVVGKALVDGLREACDEKPSTCED